MSQTHRWGVPDAAGGADAAGLSDTFFLLGNTFFVLAVCWRKIFSNFLKFSLFFHFFSFFSKFCKKLSGVPDAAGLSDTFLVLEILVEKNFLKFSQIFSNFLGIHFYVLAIAENFLKFSQLFTFFHFFSKILQKISGVPDAAGLSDTFLVLEILVEKKLSQIFSNFLGIHFYVLAMGGTGREWLSDTIFVLVAYREKL